MVSIHFDFLKGIYLVTKMFVYQTGVNPNLSLKTLGTEFDTSQHTLAIWLEH